MKRRLKEVQEVSKGMEKSLSLFFLCFPGYGTEREQKKIYVKNVRCGKRLLEEIWKVRKSGGKSLFFTLLSWIWSRKRIKRYYTEKKIHRRRRRLLQEVWKAKKRKIILHDFFPPFLDMVQEESKRIKLKNLDRQKRRPQQKVWQSGTWKIKDTQNFNLFLSLFSHLVPWKG